MSSWCLVVVGRLFLAVPRGCLQFVIVVFPGHTHLLFLKEKVHSNSLNQGLKFQTGVLAGQMHINSLNLRLNFKPRFENLKLSFERKSAH